jgi:hypothetical protein
MLNFGSVLFVDIVEDVSSYLIERHSPPTKTLSPHIQPSMLILMPLPFSRPVNTMLLNWLLALRFKSQYVRQQT